MLLTGGGGSNTDNTLSNLPSGIIPSDEQLKSIHNPNGEPNSTLPSDPLAKAASDNAVATAIGTATPIEDIVNSVQDSESNNNNNKDAEAEEKRNEP